MHEINIRLAKNGWLLVLSDEEGGKEFELFEHDVNTDFDMSPDNQAHKLPAMRDMLISIGRHLLELNPESQETITVGVSERDVQESNFEHEEIVDLSPADQVE